MTSLGVVFIVACVVCGWDMIWLSISVLTDLHKETKGVGLCRFLGAFLFLVGVMIYGIGFKAASKQDPSDKTELGINKEVSDAGSN